FTTIVISHRLSTIKCAETIFFFGQEGKIEVGRHEQLLLQSPDYRKFFQDQLGDTLQYNDVLEKR
ncbi:MAG: hypothetical protein NC923_03820, partial [Candidatus Omnitrophica bacterium]|nr:hypothetical protein [Candidatus Omnitrophota bacterium]